jgi:ribosome maturation factor RimP
MYRDIPEDLRTLIEPVVADSDFELVDVMITKGRPPWTVRITIDTQSADGRVPVDHCANVSRELEAQFDAADVFPSAYRLEVSSPGLDRVLSREKDFAAARGSEVKIETYRPLDGRRRFRGTLVRFEAGQATVSVDGCEISIPFAEVAKANMFYKFSPSDFSGR